MEQAQRDYKARHNLRHQARPYQPLSQKMNADSFYSEFKAVDPEPPNLQEAYLIQKMPKYRNILIKRYFSLTDTKFLQYHKNDLKAPCKTSKLNGA
jgi:hypothetical protein